MSEPHDTAAAHPPTLVVACDGTSHTVQPGDSPVTIGRELPADIRIADPRLSRMHARLEVQAGQWVLSDAGSTNGVFVGARRVQSAPITSGMIVHLGHAEGIPVTFTYIPSGATTSEKFSGIAAEPDPGVARAGAAVVERRLELGYSQRHLVEADVVGRGELAAFEGGRRWPEEAIRTRIEDYLRWPPGTIARIRDGAPPPDDDEEEHTTEFLSDRVRISVLLDAVEIALEGIHTRIDALPPYTDSEFAAPATSLLIELRRLMAMLSISAGSTKSSPQLALAVGTVRRAYHAVMEESARRSDATVGQRLYMARYRHHLSAAEVAHAAGVAAADVEDCEAGRLVSPEKTDALTAMLSVLTAA
ncbi:FHA domain-containing protein [Mycobacterium sp. GA-2829]|uniref:FHA domain-containing protein n=1 Tax=Mycobacterium sp. GA-2829 TaxID=1772283 RepID=UPI000A43F54D|nr:FHA domain-containing protein [Mycobacterium sp. GA-2829]